MIVVRKKGGACVREKPVPRLSYESCTSSSGRLTCSNVRFKLAEVYQ